MNKNNLMKTIEGIKIKTGNQPEEIGELFLELINSVEEHDYLFKSFSKQAEYFNDDEIRHTLDSIVDCKNYYKWCKKQLADNRVNVTNLPSELNYLETQN